MYFCVFRAQTMGQLQLLVMPANLKVTVRSVAIPSTAGVCGCFTTAGQHSQIKILVTCTWTATQTVSLSHESNCAHQLLAFQNIAPCLVLCVALVSMCVSVSVALLLCVCLVCGRFCCSCCVMFSVFCCCLCNVLLSLFFCLSLLSPMRLSFCFLSVCCYVRALSLY